jgi:transaldolase/glucose-6-phosphate isomerase
LGANATLESWLKAHFARLKGSDYFALLAYVDAAEARLQALQGLRAAVRDRKRIATCLQFGPRFLHSTGQAYKGGPNSASFSRSRRGRRPISRSRDARQASA